MPYDHAKIEAAWQAFWDERETFKAEVDRSKPKYYVLDMFPYPSGSGLHVGHPEGYTATDIVARYKRMKGFNVLHPMGWDSFGLPAERYAMKTGTHPRTRTDECIVNFKRQLKMLGFSYDWSREVATTDTTYFKWTQWIFLQIWGSWYDREQQKARPIAELPIPAEVEADGEAAVRAYRDTHRMAYLHEAPVNWCPDLRVVLANEEVAEQVDAGHEVVRVPMRQWMLKITEYSQRLIDDLEGLDWPTSVLEMQRNWIGRSEGAEVHFQVVGVEGLDGDAGRLSVFTTRPDTLFGATYMVLAPEHPLVGTITTADNREDIEAYVEQTARRSERERQAAAAEGDKTGVFTGAHAINPVNGEQIPIWIADYVLMGYGTGAIMAVPGHDVRDHAFAKTMGLPIIQVVAPADGGEIDVQEAAYPEPGVALNSSRPETTSIDGLATAEATATISAWLAEQQKGEARVNYKLRDWLFSRQRYWGEPFPLIHGADGEVRPVPEAKLPVTLPEVEDFNPSETGEPPLAKATAWVELPDGSRRETNTMPQWAGSCWYYLRFCDPRNADAPWSSDAEDYWMPVDLYIGGAEHAVLHLLYARFWHKVLFDLGHVSTREPFQKLINQGMVLGATYVPAKQPEGEAKRIFVTDDIDEVEDGSFVHKQTGEPLTIRWDKMSKSRGNVVNPDEVISEYGADTMRLYEMFMGPLEASAPWQPEGVNGCFRFLGRAYRLFFESPRDEDDRPRALGEGEGEGSERQRRLLHRTIADVSERIERMGFNTAISSLMVFVRDIEQGGERMTRAAGARFCLMLAPFAPHLAEELWRSLGNDSSLAYEAWPQADPALLVEDTWTLVVQVKGKKRGQVEIPSSLDPKQDREKIQAMAMASDAVERFVGDKTPKRVIYVPGRLINIVL